MTATRLATLVILAGGAAATGHAPFHLLPVSLAGFAVFFWGVVQRAGVKEMAFAAWLGGTGYFAVALHWIVEPFLVDVARHGWMAPFALVLLSGGLALFWGAAGGVAAWLGQGRGRRAKAFAFIVMLALAEALRGYVLSGFPWALPGYIWLDTLLAYSAAVVGPFGLTFLTLLIGALPVLFGRVWTGAVPLLAFALLYFVDAALPTTSDVLGKVRLVQPNAPQDEKWDPERAHVFVDRLIVATAAPKADIDMIIWPETALPYRLSVATPVLQRAAGDAEGVPVVLGINRSEDGRNYNALIQLGPRGVPVDVYNKVRLVPFGEFIPLGQLAEFAGIRSFAARDGYGFSAGDGVRMIDTPLGKALPLICYEAIFPQHIRALGARPDYLLQITNDAWFGSFSGPFQHLDQARFRSIEQGLPMVRVANTGVSAVIDRNGRVIDHLGLNETGYLDTYVPAGGPATIYSRTGDIPVLLLLIVLFAALVVQRSRNGIANQVMNG